MKLPELRQLTDGDQCSCTVHRNEPLQHLRESVFLFLFDLDEGGVAAMCQHVTSAGPARSADVRGATPPHYDKEVTAQRTMKCSVDAQQRAHRDECTFHMTIPAEIITDVNIKLIPKQ